MNLTELFQQNGKVLEMEFPVTNELLEKASFTNGSAIEDSLVKMKFQNMEKGKVLVEGKGEIFFQTSCDRCLADVREETILDFYVELYAPEIEIDEDTKEEQYYLEGYELDLLALVREELQIAWPTKILCKADCKGICKKCGINLNKESCQCDDFVPDVRLANLMDLFMSSQS